MHESRAGFDYDFALLIPRRTPHIKDGNARLILRDLCMFKPASVIVWLTLTSIFDYAHPVAVVAIPSSKRKPNFWFSLGDSYTATGFDPSGILPSIGNPLGNPPYPGSTATRGANWVDYLTTTYNESLIFTYNLAYGGATIDSKLVKPYLPTVKSLTDQVNEYMASFSDHPASVPWKTRNTLFSIWIGINDIGNSFYLGGDRNEFNEVLLDAYFRLVEKLYNTGARRFFFINVPPVDRSPLMSAYNTTVRATEKRVIADYNTKLLFKILDLELKHADVNIWFWDSNAAFTDILDNPKAYGFKDATSYGSNPAYFWGNNYHPGSTAHKIFASKISQLLSHPLWY